MKSQTKLTSVKIIDDLYKRFKQESIVEEFTLQKLVNRSIHMFLNDNEYNRDILEYSKLTVSGSNF
tara:strand:- start:361 stop:558 length:198 start_codon:yes stop_codon:yes gene_type:complete